MVREKASFNQNALHCRIRRCFAAALALAQAWAIRLTVLLNSTTLLKQQIYHTLQGCEGLRWPAMPTPTVIGTLTSQPMLSSVTFDWSTAYSLETSALKPTAVQPGVYESDAAIPKRHKAYRRPSSSKHYCRFTLCRQHRRRIESRAPAADCILHDPRNDEAGFHADCVHGGN
jgi:hypothetical protein